MPKKIEQLKKQRPKPQPDWARRLSAARYLTGYNQTAFARRCRISQQLMSKYERGESWPGPETWKRILSELPKETLDSIVFGPRPSSAE